jgi:hypothetical protein
MESEFGMEFRKFSSKRQIVDYAHLLTMGEDYVLCCVPKVSIAVARVLLSERGLWRSTYTKGFRNDGEYFIPDEAEMDFVREKIAEFLYQTGDYEMSMCEDLVTSLDGIKTAIEGIQCSCGGSGDCGECGEGTGGSGSAEEPETTNEDDGETPPPGFETYGEYETYKCDAVEQLRQNLINDLTWMRDADILTMTVTGAVAAFVLPVPGARIVSIVGFAVALILQGLLFTVAQEIITALTDFADEFRCDLYNALDVQEARDVSDDSLGLGVLATQLFGSFLTNDALNRLFESHSIGSFGADCSGCRGELELIYGASSDDLVTGSPITISSEFATGAHRIYIRGVASTCPSLWTANLSVNTATSAPNGTGATYNWGACPSYGIKQTWDPKIPTGSYPDVIGISQVKDDAPFSITVQFDV